MDAHDRLVGQVAQEQDDILATLQLVSGDSGLEDRLYEQLTDLLVESLFLDLRRQHLEARIDQERYRDEVAALSALCREAGLLPLSTWEG